MPREADDEDDPQVVERRRVAYLRHHREQLQQRQRLEAERREGEFKTDVVAMRARRDDVRAAKQAEDDKSVAGKATFSTEKVPGIYSRLDDLDEEELQLLAKQYETGATQEQINTRGKYHSRCIKDAYPIAGSQFKLEKERELGAAAKKKLLLTDVVAERDSNAYGHRRKECGVLNFDLERSRSRSKFERYMGNLEMTLQREQEQVRRTEAARQLRLSQEQHRQGLEQFWRLMHTASKREVIAWLTFHEFLDVNIPVRVTRKENTEYISVCEDRGLGMTPLMAACRSWSVDLVHCLLEHGAVVTLTTANGDTAIHFLWRDWAAESTGSMKDLAALIVPAQRVQDILAALIAKGADVNAQNAFGETALQFCARHGLQDCAKLLLAKGADPFVRDRKGNSAVQYALDHHHDGLYRLLMHYDVVERTRALEKERHDTSVLLKQKRGALTSTWSQSSEDFFANLKLEQLRAGHLRNQYVDSNGEVIVCSDEED